MTISFVNYSSSAPGGSGTTLDISAPANIVEGNLLVAGVSVSTAGLTYTITPPTGWTSIASTYTGGLANSTKAELFYKIATNSEPTTYQFSFDVTVSTRRAQISQFSGVDTSNPVDASGQTFSSTATSVDMPSLTVSTGAVYYAYVRSNQDTTHTYQSSMTGQQLSRHSFAYETITSGGSTGTRTCTFGASAGYGGIVFGIKPAGSGTTYDESVSISSSKSIVDTNLVNYLDNISVSFSKGISDATFINFTDGIAVSFNNGVFSSLENIFYENVTIGHSLFYSEANNPSLDISDFINLQQTKSFAFQAILELFPQFILQQTKSDSYSSQKIIDTLVNLIREQGIFKSLVLVYENSISLNQSSDFGLIDGMAFDDGLLLFVNKTVVQVSFVFNFNQPIPVIRIIPVLKENRILSVDKENRIMVVLKENRIIVPQEEANMIEKLKHPQAVKDYRFDFKAFTNNNGSSDWLESGETITSYAISVPLDLTVVASSLVDGDTAVVVWISGGVSGFAHDVSCTITTSAGRTEIVTFVLKIDENYL